MEDFSSMFLPNKSLDYYCWAQYGKNALWGLLGLTIFFILRYYKNKSWCCDTPNTPQSASPVRPTVDYRLLYLVPKALVGKQSTRNLANLSAYLDRMDYLHQYTDSIYRRTRYQRLTTFIGPFPYYNIELPDLEDQGVVNDYIQLHMYLSKKYFEEGKYLRGFYHFVLLNFCHRDPMVYMRIRTVEVVDAETLMLTRRFLEFLMFMMECQIRKRDN